MWFFVAFQAAQEFPPMHSRLCIYIATTQMRQCVPSHFASPQVNSKKLVKFWIIYN